MRGDHGFLPVVRGVNLTLEEGETLAIVGESGSGKSVTSLALMGLLDPKAKVEGNFQYNGQNFSPETGALRGHGLSMIFQNPMSSLNPVMKVGKQVAEPLLMSGGKSDPVREQVSALFGEVGLPTKDSFYHNYPHQLSGGMRQRVMIAIALACRPRILLADEPTTALDVTVQAQILSLLDRLRKENETGILFITHDFGVVSAICDRVAVMYAGKIVETGATEEILSQPAHPYTAKLIECVPVLGEPERRLGAISGRPPVVNRLPEGCAFAPRCHKATGLCATSEIELTGTGRKVRCILPEEDVA